MSDGVSVRAARPDDGAAIDALIRAAFADSGFGHQGEADLVRMIEADGDALVSLVAEVGGMIAGHILFSRMAVEADGRALAAAALAPLAVGSAHRRHGIGAMLIRAGLAALRDRGTAISFVLGDTAYYSRFGYSAELAARFASPFAGPHFMATMLGDADWPSGGRAAYAPAFDRLG